MADGTFRGRWLDAVFRSPQITDAVRVALLALATEMDDAGRVSVSREDLALRLNRGKARVTERLQAAVDSGLLVREVAGKRGRVAEYSAALPIGSAYPDLNDGDPEADKGPDQRTESVHFGSGLQTLTDARLGPDCRPKVNTFGPDGRTSTTSQGSAYPDPLSSSEVEVAVDLDEVTTDGGLFEEEITASRMPPKKPRKGSSVPRTSIPADFAVEPDMRAWAREKAPLVGDIDLQTERFVNHFLDKPHEKRPGWRRSWNNWMLQQQSWAADRNVNVLPLRPSGRGGHMPYQNPDDESVYHEELKP